MDLFKTMNEAAARVKGGAAKLKDFFKEVSNQTTYTEVPMNGERFANETFEDYKKRRLMQRAMLKSIRRGRPFWDSNAHGTRWKRGTGPGHFITAREPNPVKPGSQGAVA